MQPKFALVTLFVAALAIIPLSAQEAETGKPEPAVRIGQPAPDFTLLDCEGNKHTLSDYKDKIVVLEWVNQQCPWSVKAVPVVKEIRGKYAKDSVVWLGIESTHNRKPEENIQYAKDHELGFPILMDNDGRVGRLYQAKTTPHLYVINKGKLVYMGALHNNQQGPRQESEVRHYVDEAIRAVLDGKDVPVAETTAWGCTVKYKPQEEKKR